MLIITYDSENGRVVQDAKVESYCTSLIECTEQTDVENEVIVGSSIIIDQFRVLVKEGKIKYKNIIFRFNDVDIRINVHGDLENYPRGFCDYNDLLLNKLAGWA